MCRPIDFLYENVKEAKICFGYNLESIVRQLCALSKIASFSTIFPTIPIMFL